jgi:single-stranded-DNA-specific exonuclease
VHYGLVVLNKTRRLGLRKLIQASHGDKPVTTTGIGYRLGPWINAAGRINHANMAVSLMLATTEAEAEQFTQQLGETNTQRQEQTETMFKEAKQQAHGQAHQRVLFIYGEEWPLGLVGLVAGKLVSEFNKPTFVMTKNNDEISGSGRSLKGLNMITNLQHIDHLFSRYGGHAMACGFTLKQETTIEQFSDTFIKQTESIIAELDPRAQMNVAAELELKQVNWELIEQLDLLQPFGEQNPEPQFLIKQVKVKDFQTVGNNQNHLRLVLTDNSGKAIKAIAFGFGDYSKQLSLGDSINIVCKLSINEWNGNREIQITINAFPENV